jgi:hypothetical protein
MPDYELDSLTTVAHEAGAGTIVTSRKASHADALTCSILHAQQMYPNAMAQPLDDAL